MELNEIIAEILMAPINLAYWLLTLIADWWGVGVALAVGIIALILLRKK